MSKMSGGDALISSLEREGVEVIFGLPGVQMYGVVDALRRNKNIKNLNFIITKHISELCQKINFKVVKINKLVTKLSIFSDLL